MEIAGVIRSEDAIVVGRIGAMREVVESSFAYDAANRMTAAMDSGGASLATFDYDNLGHPAWEQYAGTGAKVSFSWSNEGDLLTLGHALQGTAAVSFTDGYTPAHQIASSSIDNGLYQYVPQMSGTDSYAPNALNQYASVTPAGAAVPVSIGYDLKGNLTSDGTFSFAYDAENKLMTAAKTGTAVAYAYDPLGRRDGKTVNGLSTWFLSADADEVAEYDGSGTLLRRYIPGPAIDRPIAMVDAAGTRTFFHQDKTGSVVAMSDTAGNKTEGPYTYDSFGNGAPYTGVPFKFTGRRLDPETGLYYYRARYYTSALGRFLQTDSIGYTDDIDWYTYAGNDPANRVDPYGNAGLILSFGGSGEAGLPPFGHAAAQGSFNLGILVDQHGHISVVGYRTTGATAALGMQPSKPQPGQKNPLTPLMRGDNSHAVVVGAFAGGGFSVGITNANTGSDLAGKAAALTGALGLGPVQGSVQFSKSANGIWTLNVSGGPMGLGFGLDASAISTNSSNPITLAGGNQASPASSFSPQQSSRSSQSNNRNVPFDIFDDRITAKACTGRLDCNK